MLMVIHVKTAHPHPGCRRYYCKGKQRLKPRAVSLCAVIAIHFFPFLVLAPSIFYFMHQKLLYRQMHLCLHVSMLSLTEVHQNNGVAHLKQGENHVRFYASVSRRHENRPFPHLRLPLKSKTSLFRSCCSLQTNPDGQGVVSPPSKTQLKFRGASFSEANR